MVNSIQVRLIGQRLNSPVNSGFKQKGIALPLTLILLLAMTLIAVATLRTTTLEENMTANTRLRQIAFYAAETVLREAEIGVGEFVQRARGRQALGGDGLRSSIFGAGIIVPNINAPGDLCEAGDFGGYCTPAIHTYSEFGIPRPEAERWEDDSLDVWNTAGRHIEFQNLVNNDLAGQGVVEAPKYIVEFLGNYDFKELNVSGAIRPRYAGAFTGPCRDNATNRLDPPNNVWPYCPSDSALFRITVRATAGPEARQAEVILQSNYRYTGD